MLKTVRESPSANDIKEEPLDDNEVPREYYDQFVLEKEIPVKVESLKQEKGNDNFIQIPMYARLL